MKKTERNIIETVAVIEAAKAGEGPPVLIDVQRLDGLDVRIKKALGIV